MTVESEAGPKAVTAYEAGVSDYLTHATRLVCRYRSRPRLTLHIDFL